MFTYLKTLRLSIDKERALIKESVRLEDYINSQNINIITTPFPHIVVDNFFKKEIHDKLLNHFQNVLDRGLSQGSDHTRFHTFYNLKGKFSYDGYVYTPRFGEEHTLDLFFSLAWNLFFSKLFKQPNGWCTSLAYHYHPAGNKTGWIHHDYVDKWFTEEDRLPNGIIFNQMEKREPARFPERRIITLIYYLGLEDLQGAGGQTGLFADEHGPLVKLIAPVNNRLFSFQVSPKSFHAFQANSKPRMSIIQWFHIFPEWGIKKYGK